MSRLIGDSDGSNHGQVRVYRESATGALGELRNAGIAVERKQINPARSRLER